MAIGMEPQAIINQQARLRGDREMKLVERFKKTREVERLQVRLANC
jgi:hypothetical protein